jgi:predicted TIM-barrel fold metal-dependent hydrolase
MSARLAPNSTPETRTLPFAGQVLDADGHFYIEPGPLRELLKGLDNNDGGYVLDFLQRFVGSDEDLRARAANRDRVWATKGISALGAADPVDRIEAMDAMGVRAQLLFPNTLSTELRVNTDAARAVCRAYNDLALAWSRRGDPDRLRVTAQINMGKVDWAYAELERCIKAGFHAITMPCAEPPGGVSPANRIWDRFWSMLEEADVTATIHLGNGGLTAARDPLDPMLPQHGWHDADALNASPAARAGGEEAVSPYFVLVGHIPAEVYLITMVMGRVFERHPRLRFGIFEFGVSWLGPTCERMDTWAGFLERVSGQKYSMKPSDFVRRNVRIAPFFHEKCAEPVRRYALQDVFCFMSDFPHHEGGRDPVGAAAKWLGEIGPHYDKQFYVDNAKLLFAGV